MEELRYMMTQFAASGWDLIAIPARQWLAGHGDREALITVLRQAQEECGHCGCALDALYPRALALRDLF